MPIPPQPDRKNGQALLKAVKKQVLSTLRKVKKAKPSSFLADDQRSLYLCFGEYGEGGEVCYTISSIKLSQLCGASPMKLEMVKKFSSEGLPRYMGCGIWNSKIVFGGGALPDHTMVKQIYSFETSNGAMEILPDMLESCMLPMLVEVDNKLYALGKSYDPSFQVFDGNCWSQLPSTPYMSFLYHPFTHPHPECRQDVFFAAAEKYLLFCSCSTSFYFDTAKPDERWRKLGTISPTPFNFGGTSLIVNDGKQFVHFTFEPDEGLHISVHLIPYGFNKIVDQDYSRVELPPYLLQYQDDRYGDIPLANYKLVHLGGNKVCLFLSELRTDGGKKKTRCVQCMAFTFKVLDSNRFKVKYLPPFPTLMYDDDDMDVPLSAGQMLGAFIM